MRSYSAIIAAAGSSQRYGKEKLREKVGGKAVLSHSIDRFDDDEHCSEVILCVGPALREWIDSSPLLFSSPKLKVVDGGPSRAESVANGVRAASAELLAIHDAARPNFTAELLEKLRRAVEPGVGVVPALPVADTLAYVNEGGAGPRAGGGRETTYDSSPAFTESQAGTGTRPTIDRYIDRGGVQAIQTPQFFERASYLQALEQAGAALAGFSDDSSLYLAAGFAVTVVPGLPGNLKLTTPADLQQLLKLMGGGVKKSKDKYGGLGW